jgi:3-oxoacyl-[acyl-carrier protein] reductase
MQRRKLLIITRKLSEKVAFGSIDTRLTQAKEQGNFIEVEGKKVQLGIPQQNLADKDRLIPLRRVGNVEEAAGAILLLASPFASYITGIFSLP